MHPSGKEDVETFLIKYLFSMSSAAIAHTVELTMRVEPSGQALEPLLPYT
jgi:hypothetical protein